MIIEQYELPVVGNEQTDRDRLIEAMAFKHENKVTKLASRSERLNARLTRLAAKAESKAQTVRKIRETATKAPRSGKALDSHIAVWAGVMFTLAYQAVNIDSYSALIGGVR